MKELLTNKSARLMWFARTFSRFGDAFESLALLYLVYDLTESALAMGTIMVFSVIPNILVSPFAGAIADKYSQRLIMGISECVRTVAILILPLLHILGVLQLWHIYVIAVIVSIAESFFEPCAQIVMTVIVKKSQLALYDSVVTTSNHIARIIGYSLSGIVISLLSMDVVFVIDSITFAFSALVAFLVEIPYVDNEEVAEDSIFKGIKKSVKYIFSMSMVIAVLLGVILNGMLLVPISEFIPIVVEDLLKVDSSWAGMFMTILSLGTLLSSVVFPKIIETKLKLRHFILCGQVALGVMLLLVALKPNIIFSILLYIVSGFIASTVTMWSSLEIQNICKIDYLGRVSSIFTMALIISDPLSGGISGVLIDVISIKNVFLIIAILFAVFGLIIYFLMKKAALQESYIDIYKKLESEKIACEES